MAQKFTKEQAIVITGFTGIRANNNFDDFREDLEKRLGEPITMIGIAALGQEKIAELYEEDFLKMCN